MQSTLFQHRRRGWALAWCLLAAALVCQVNSAAAAISWCRADPGIMIGGKLTNIEIDRDAGVANFTPTGPTQVVVTVPVGVSTSVVSLDNGFGVGYAISFQTDPTLNTPGGGQITIRVAVFVPAADTTTALQVVSTPLDPRFGPQAKKGAPNAWITMNTQV